MYRTRSGFCKAIKLCYNIVLWGVTILMIRIIFSVKNRWLVFYLFVSLLSAGFSFKADFAQASDPALMLDFYSQELCYKSNMFPTVSSFFDSVKNLPSHYQQGADYAKHSAFGIRNKKQAWLEFKMTMKACYQTIVRSSLADSKNWMVDNRGQITPPAIFYNLNKMPPFIPYAQKIDEQPGAKFILRGDLHGDIFSLVEEIAYLQKHMIIDDFFNIVNPKTYLIFLGDFIDRGAYGPEVVYLLMRLKIANPERVVLVRGNHDDIRERKKVWGGGWGGFDKQMDKKFQSDLKKEFKPSEQIGRFYDLLPVVLYVGCDKNYVQCCHGGIEPGYLPGPFLDSNKKYQMIGKLCRKMIIPLMQEPEKTELENFSRIKNRKIPFKWSCFDLSLTKYATGQFGLMWNDFDPHNHVGVQYQHEFARPLMFGKNMTKAILKAQSTQNNKLHAILRGHQHNSTEMFNQLKAHSGVLNMWHLPTKTKIKQVALGTVWTFNAAPDQPVSGIWNKYGFDAFAMLTVAKNYEDWKMEVVNIQIVSSLLSSPTGSLSPLVKI